MLFLTAKSTWATWFCKHSCLCRLGDHLRDRYIAPSACARRVEGDASEPSGRRPIVFPTIDSDHDARCRLALHFFCKHSVLLFSTFSLHLCAVSCSSANTSAMNVGSTADGRVRAATVWRSTGMRRSSISL